MIQGDGDDIFDHDDFGGIHDANDISCWWFETVTNEWIPQLQDVTS